jgi:hypothetical protein
MNPGRNAKARLLICRVYKTAESTLHRNVRSQKLIIQYPDWRKGLMDAQEGEPTKGVLNQFLTSNHSAVS